MVKLLDKLKFLGVDVREVLDRFLDDEELYVQCYKMFIDDPSFKRLGEAVAANDLSKAFDAAHDLKGVSANLGLTSLYEITTIVVEALRRGDSSNLQAQYAAILAERRKYVELLTI